MTLERLLFDCETLHTLEGLFEISLDLLGTSLGGPGFDISPTPELSTARLAFDGGVIVYGIGHFESGLPALAAIKFDADFVFGHGTTRPVEKQTRCYSLGFLKCIQSKTDNRRKGCGII